MSQISPSIARKPVQGAASFSKSIALLQMIADSARPISISNLLQKSGLPRPTLHRMLKALLSEGLLEVGADKTYTAGPRLISLAGRALDQNHIARIADNELSRLCHDTSETVYMATYYNRRLVYLIKKESPKAVRITSTLGGHVPMHASALGKSVLAFMDDKEQEELIASLNLVPFTPYTVSCPDKLKLQLDAIRRQGFALSSQETDLEIECYGCPILDRNENPVAGVSVSVPLYRKKSQQDYLQPLVECCARISSQLNG